MQKKDLLRKKLTSRESRRSYCRDSLFLFGIYYFAHYMTHDFAFFHTIMTSRLSFRGFYKYLIFIMFRESAKTAWAKIFVIWCICYKKKRYMKYVCYDVNKSKGHLFDIAVELQSNRKIIRDFGQLFFEGEFEGDDKSEKKSIGEFVTSNGIKVQAGSTGISTRGDVYGPFRPDLYILDDFETDKTKRSKKRTDEVINYIDELTAGTSVDANILYLCNRLTKKGSVAYIEKKALENPNWKKVEVRLLSRKTGKVAWTAKFVQTDEEAWRINSSRKDPKTHVFSIEAKIRDLGTARFNQEYNNIPIEDDEMRYKPEWIDANYYSELPRTELMNIVMAVDPNAGQSKLADFMGIVIMGQDRNTRLRYVLAVYAEKLTIDRALDKLKTIYDLWKPAQIGIEVVRSQRALYELAKASNHFRLKKLDPEGRDKIDRSASVEPLVENGTIKFNPLHKAFHDELLAFPNGDHDDMVDGFIYANKMLDKFSPRRLSTTKSPGVTAGLMNKNF